MCSLSATNSGHQAQLEQPRLLVDSLWGACLHSQRHYRIEKHIFPDASGLCLRPRLDVTTQQVFLVQVMEFLVGKTCFRLIFLLGHGWAGSWEAAACIAIFQVSWELPSRRLWSVPSQTCLTRFGRVACLSAPESWRDQSTRSSILGENIWAECCQGCMWDTAKAPQHSRRVLACTRVFSGPGRRLVQALLSARLSHDHQKHVPRLNRQNMNQVQ